MHSPSNKTFQYLTNKKQIIHLSYISIFTLITCIWKREVTLLNVDRISFGYQPVYVYPSTGKQELFNRSSTCSGLEIMQNNRFYTFHDRSILCFIRVSTGRTLIQPAEHMVLDERGWILALHPSCDRLTIYGRPVPLYCWGGFWFWNH